MVNGLHWGISRFSRLHWEIFGFFPDKPQELPEKPPEYPENPVVRIDVLCVSLCVVGIFTVGGGWTCYGEWTSLHDEKVQERRMMRRCFNLRLVCTSEITWEISRVSRGPSRGMSLLCVSLCVVGIFTVGGGWTCYGEWTSLRNFPVFQTSLRNFRIFPRQTSGITWETSRVSREPSRRMDLLCGKDRLAMCDG